VTINCEQNFASVTLYLGGTLCECFTVLSFTVLSFTVLRSIVFRVCHFRESINFYKYINNTNVVTSQEYEAVLEQYSLSPAELENGFTRIASITFAHNTKRATSSASELGRNVLSQDVEKMRQRYDKLLVTLKRK